MIALQDNYRDLLPGERVILHNISWSEFEDLLPELDEYRATRLAYDNGRLEIMVPLPEHEHGKEIIGDLLKVLLEELDIEFCSLGSTTFKKSELKGIEPDQCFYIANEAAIRGKNRLDLNIDPPPDLVLEIEITSRTHPEIYAELGVPELWRFTRGKLQINVLENGQYREVAESPTFPGLPLPEILAKYLAQSKLEGRNRAVKQFRQWLGDCV
ncbi:Uma2 family endonuclease [Roseofilum casamattae]|uniref:Uma2 family endonuclease n=1 Tax=Roseofilum casamattae BLCC-M143 TaxID=3022442 RepID=A0ABT7BY51_9CYAN|nr:Uma2 family endonuclease [Roseofilum casamattae]MDJ1183995.1 Uma2 family endonuclease [Roseofilum casamattae BLCC-M143]